MIAVTPALYLLVAVSMAAPTADPSACAADDLQCSARAFTSAARHAKSDAERVEYLYFASRTYLALSERSPQSPASSRDLCQAKQLIDQAAALPATELRERVTTSRQETRTRLKKENIRCHQPKPRTKDDQPLVALAGPQAKSEGPATTRGTSSGMPEPVSPNAEVAKQQRVSGSDASSTSPRPPPVDAPAHAAEPTSEPPPLLTSNATSEPPAREPPSAVHPQPPPTVGPRPDETLMPIPDRRMPTGPQTDGPRPGHGLVIAGGVMLGVGVALTAGAGHMGRRMNETRQEYFTLVDSISGFATPDEDAKAGGLLREYNAMRTQALTLAVAGSTTIVVAAVLAGVGGRRMARAASRTALVPVPGGLALYARF